MLVLSRNNFFLNGFKNCLISTDKKNNVNVIIDVSFAILVLGEKQKTKNKKGILIDELSFFEWEYTFISNKLPVNELVRKISCCKFGNERLHRLNNREVKIIKYLLNGRRLISVSKFEGLSYKKLCYSKRNLIHRIGIENFNFFVRLVNEWAYFEPSVRGFYNKMYSDDAIK